MTMNKIMIASFTALILFSGCERSVNGLSEPGLSQEPFIFTDTFIGMGADFYFPFQGARPDVFSVDDDEGFESNSSIRIDVPNANDLAGNFAGAIFRIDGSGRDLTEYNALTFYAKASQGVNLGQAGFGLDFITDTYQTSTSNLSIGTNWSKYIIPIPDPSKLVNERGVFWLSAGSSETDGFGYTLWFDDLQFEYLPTIAQPRPSILSASDDTTTSFIGSGTSVTNLAQTVNLPSGRDISVAAAAAYFEFSSSNANVATVDQEGNVSVVGTGTATITATLNGIEANGSLTVESLGEYVAAPTPTAAPANVISIFSDSYDNVPVDFYNGFYAPFQTTTSNDFVVNGDNVLGYENFNFVGIEFNQNVPTIDGSAMTSLRMDVFIPNDIPAGSALRLNLRDFGPNGVFGTPGQGGNGDDTIASLNLTSATTPALVSGQWITFDLDISSMARRANLGQIVLDADLGTSFRGSTFYVDNIYLTNE